ncbi:RNA polymerase sigma factor [Patulibacter sp. NPDC049589]|uniref:RNA polymerase sigma factor n=1 Tax=Patulibacter sp. NPDC049589 TaxID=3154731 RepID=UPI0034321D91
MPPPGGLPRRDRDDDPAFVALFRDAQGPVLRFLRRRLGDRAAEDAAADVFERALRQHRDGRLPVDAGAAWLLGIATNVISERRRAERRRLRALERLSSRAAPAPRPDEQPGGEPALDPDLVRALAALTPIDRDALLLLAWGELSYDEIATALAVPIGTVRSRIARARRHLDATLSPAAPAHRERHDLIGVPRA